MIVLYEGKLIYQDDNSYTIFNKGESRNITEILNNLYQNYKKVFFNMQVDNKSYKANGIVSKVKIAPKFYSTCIGNIDVEGILFKNAGRKVKINIGW